MILNIPIWSKRKLFIEISVKPSFDEVIVSILKNNRWQNEEGLWLPDKVKAIKFHRNADRTMGLAESKKYIEKLMSDYNVIPLLEWDQTKVY